MRFHFNNAEYSISFTRKIEPVTRYNGEVVTPKHPQTTVSISKVFRPTTEGEKTTYSEYRTATVGTFYTEKEFTYEKGRLAALRSVSRTIDKPFKKAMWKAYCSRPRG